LTSKLMASKATVLILSLLMISSFLAAIPVQAIPTTKPHNADAMWVEPFSNTFVNGMPNATVGQKFNVTVWLNMTEDIYGYQVLMHFNATLLQVNRVGYTSYFLGHSVFTAITIDNTVGTVLVYESCQGVTDFIAGPRNDSLFWAEFAILAAPTTGNFASQLDISTEYGTSSRANTWVIASDGITQLSFSPYDGNYLFKLTQYTSVTIIASNGNETQTFNVSVIVPDLTMVSTQEAITNVASQIHLTEEQRAAVLNSSSVTIMTSSGSRIEITQWFNFWGFPLGVAWHAYLTAMDAMSIEQALEVLAVIFGFLAALLSATVVLAALALVTALILAIVKIDFGRMYDGDKNADGSFDMWGEDTLYQMFWTYANVETPRYVWLATVIGAYVIRDKTSSAPPPNPSEWWECGGGGGRARAI
jgi:hypothetical protein